MHHAIVEVNIVIGVVLGEVLVARVVPLVVDAVIRLALSLIAHVVVVVVVFVVAIFCTESSCMGDTLFTVKHAENSRDRELVKKIENHPHRQSLQRDLQQNKAYNSFNTTTKKMIQDVGNVELLELFETNTKTQCTKCLSYWSEGMV